MTEQTPTPRAASKGGRPAKFAEPRRPVTMTLPERILDRLAEIDADRARAVVKAVEAALGGVPDRAVEPVGELRIAPDEALLTIADSPLLRRLPWLTLIEVAPGRHVLSLRDGVPVSEKALAETMEVPYLLAPAHLNRQRAASTAVRAAQLYEECGEAALVSADDFRPEYLRVPQAERERGDKRNYKVFV